jgi:hypothetical protein
LAASCAQELPSTVPLGSGPRAEAEGSATEVANVERPKPPVHPAPDTPDASVALDAGAADASPEAGPIEAGATDAGDASPDAPAAVVFAGLYAGSDLTVYRIAGLPEQTEPDPNAKTRVEQPAPDRVALTLINSSNGDPICTLQAAVQGNVATLTPGQTCFGNGALAPAVTRGKATVNGTRLVFDMELAIDVQRGGQRATGTVVYHFDGKR